MSERVPAKKVAKLNRKEGNIKQALDTKWDGEECNNTHSGAILPTGGTVRAPMRYKNSKGKNSNTEINASKACFTHIWVVMKR